MEQLCFVMNRKVVGFPCQLCHLADSIRWGFLLSLKQMESGQVI